MQSNFWSGPKNLDRSIFEPLEGQAGIKFLYIVTFALILLL
jgi:hypothetical protein